MVPYRFRCAAHGEFDTRLPMLGEGVDRGAQPCPVCGEVAPRVYNRETAPVTDCKSFGRNLFHARTPAWKWRPKDELETQQVRDFARDEGARRQFGPGLTTGT